MNELDKDQQDRLWKVIEKFTRLKEIASKLDQAGISWAIAAGTATYVYAGGDKEKLDDVDIWIDSRDKGKVVEVLGREWLPQSSERHQAENISFEGFDFFTNCRKFKENQLLLDYLWTNSVNEHLRKSVIEGISYQVIAPEDIVVLKIVNPRESDKEDILALDQLGLDKDYLRKRLGECGVTITFNI